MLFLRRFSVCPYKTLPSYNPRPSQHHYPDLHQHWNSSTIPDGLQSQSRFLNRLTFCDGLQNEITETDQCLIILILILNLEMQILPWLGLFSWFINEWRIILGQTKHLSRRDERREGQFTFRLMSLLRAIAILCQDNKRQ